MSDKFEVDVRNHSGVLLGVEWEWDVPEGFQMVGLVATEKNPRLIVTLTRMDPSGLSENE